MSDTDHTSEHAAPLQDSVRAFDAPWQAQAFALATELSKQGHFSWAEWVAILGRKIANAPASTGEEENVAYYRQWLSALEAIVQDKGLVSLEALENRTGAWRTAYLNTPHGQPVDLRNAAASPPHAHSHVHSHGAAARRTPITIDAALA